MPTLLLYGLFRRGWNVNSQETDFYFDKTAARCWACTLQKSKLTIVPEKYKKIK